MTYAWSTWLLPALRTDPFVAARIQVIPGWQTRGRPSAEFSYLPTGIVDHHTACMCQVGHDPQSCVNVIINGNGIAPGPISQLLGTMTPLGTRWNGTNADPRIVLIAAGRCNHAGGGAYPWGAPSGNGASIGIEWCGPVVRWPDVVIELRERVDAAILKWNGWGVRQLCTHAEYAPTRKVDPSGAYIGQPSLQLLNKWDGNIWRARVARRMTTPAPAPAPIPAPTPTPIPNPTTTTAAKAATTGDDMLRIIADASKPTAPERWVTNGMVRVLPTEHSIDWLTSTGQVLGTIQQPILVSPAVLAGLPLVVG